MNRIRFLSACSKVAFLFLFLFSRFFPGDLAGSLLFACFAIMAALSLTRVKGVNLAVSCALTLAGGALFYRSGADFGQWRAAWLENAGLIALLLSTPLLAVCLRYYDFETDIRAFAARYVRSGFGFYLLVLVVSFVVSMLLNMGAVPLLFFVFEGLRKDYHERILLKALTRGYFTNVMCSPNYVSIAVVINYLGVQWGVLAGWGLGLSIAAMALSAVYEWVRQASRARQSPPREKAPAARRDERDFRRGVGWICFIVAYVMAAILALEYALRMGIAVVVPLVSLGAPVLLAVCMGRMAMLREQVRRYFRITLSGYNNEVFLFSSAGFLAFAFRSLDMGRLVVEALSRLGVNSELPLIVMLTLIIGLPTLVGVHPIVTISAIASVYTSGGLAISQTQLALVMLAGYHVYASVSPFSSGILLLANFTQRSTLSLGFGLNGVYTLLVTALYIGIIALL